MTNAFDVIAMFVVAIVCGAAFFWIGTQQGYDNGWCSAQGGSVIAVHTCNINGKVVVVK